MTGKNLELLYKLKQENNQLKVKNNHLVMENKALKKQVCALESKYETLEKSIEDIVNNAVNSAVAKATARFVETIDRLEKENKKLTKEVDRLKSQINKDSSNSSKPTSTNGFRDVVQNNRETSNKSIGGQLGHKGHKLKLPSNLEDLISQKKIKHRIIEHKKDNVIYTNDYVSRYVIDVEINTILSEHRFYNEINPINNEIIEPVIPNNLKNEVCYGNNIKALSVTLSNEGVIANKRLSSFFSEISDGIINMSTATVINFNKLFSEKLISSGQLEVIENNLLNGKSLNVDDTVLKTTEIPEKSKREREDRKVFRACLRTHSNNLNTIYTFNPQKDEEGIIVDDILPRYHGILNHDHEAKFYKYAKAHSTCHPHVNRELKAVFENLKIDFATEFVTFFNKLNKMKKSLQSENINKVAKKELKIIDDKYDKLVQKGWSQVEPLKDKNYYQETVTLLIRMEDYKKAYLLFINDFDAEYTNNLAERDLRPTKIKAKISGALRSYEGGKIYAKNRSFISTVKKRNMNILDSIKSIFNDKLVITN